MYYLTGNNITYLIFGIIVALWPERTNLSGGSSAIWTALRPAAAVILTVLAVISQAPQSFNPFIYFQF
jgi:hypothetical protein